MYDSCIVMQHIHLHHKGTRRNMTQKLENNDNANLINDSAAENMINNNSEKNQVNTNAKEDLNNKNGKDFPNTERSEEITIRPMKEEDYDKVRELWQTIGGFGIRSIDDSREDIVRFIRRNPDTSVVAQDPEGKIRPLLEDRAVDDPWYTRDFEQAYLDIVEGCRILLRKTEAERI